MGDSITDNVLGERRTNVWRRFDPWVIMIALLLSVFMIFTRSMHSFNHNDFLYAAAATRQGTLYQDIHYVQAPLGYWFWRHVYFLAPDGHAYLTMRFVSAFMTTLALAPPLVLLKGRRRAQVAFLLGIASTHYVAVSGLEIGNYSLSLLLFSIAFCFMFSAHRSRYLLAGVFFGLAASAKLSFAIFALPAALSACLLSSSSRQMAHRLALGAVGYSLGSIPILTYLFDNTSAFLFHNIAFHTEITNAYRGLTPGNSAMDIANDLLAFIVNHLFETVTALALLLASILTPRAVGSGGWQRKVGAFHSPHRVREVISVAAFFGAALIGACSPLIMFDQYLVVPGFILVTGICVILSKHQATFDTSVLSFYIIFSLVRLPLVMVPALADMLSLPSKWSLHAEASQQIQGAIAEVGLPTGCTDEIFTLSGSLAIDTGTPLSAYTEAGVFWARVVDNVPERYMQDDRFAFDPLLIDPLRHVIANNTAYVLVGYYPRIPFERELASRKTELGFASIQTISFDNRTLTLLVRQACEGQPEPH